MTRHYRQLLRLDAENEGMDPLYSKGEKYRSIPAEFVFPKQAALAREAGMTLEEYLEKRRKERG